MAVNGGLRVAVVGGDPLVLDEHVDVHVRVRERAEDPAGDPGLGADTGQRHARLVRGVRHGGHHRAFHRLVLPEHEGTGGILER